VNEILVLQLLENFLLPAGLQSKVSCLEENLDSSTDEDDGACGGVWSTLISDWCEESRDELLVPMFLRALPAFFTFLNILQRESIQTKARGEM